MIKPEKQFGWDASPAEAEQKETACQGLTKTVMQWL